MYAATKVKKLFIDAELFKLAENSVKLAGSPPIILMKIIIEEPLPRFSFVISSANHIDNIEPVVKEKMIFRASIILQLKITGFTKIKATPVLNINAQPNVKYLV